MDAELMMIATLLCLLANCRATTDNTHADLSPGYREFREHFYGLAQNKPINWTMVEHLVHDGQVSRPCFKHSTKLHDDATAFKTYAGRMLDSTGKTIPSGLFQGDWMDFGSYQGCTVDSNSAPDRPTDFRATYCRLNWGGIPREVAAGMKHYVQGVCVPNSCTDVDVTRLASTGLLGLKPMASWHVEGVLCQREEDYATYSNNAVTAIFVTAAILLLLVISALYEFIITTCLSEKTRRDLEEGKAGRFLRCFSVYNNTKKLLDTHQPPGQLSTLHGIRVISCMLIIYGHTIVMQVSVANMVDRQRVITWETSFPLYGNHLDLAADAFFLLSGLTTSYQFLKHLKRAGGIFTWKDLGMCYIHRYARVTPVYAFLLMIYACLFVYMGTGPNWADPTLKAMTELQGCSTSFWTNLLYINNYFNKCFKWAWFLAVDMQLFIVSPGIVLLLYRTPKRGIVLTLVLLVSSWVINAVRYHTQQEDGAFTVTYHNRDTIIRLGPYMIGMLLGYLLLQTNRAVPDTRKTKVLMLLGWMVCSAVSILITIPKFTFCTYGMVLQSEGSIRIKTTTFDNPGWMAFYRSLFATSVAWLVYACSVGYGGLMTEFLSWRGWAPLSRLSYAAYLVHPIILHAYTMSQKTVLFFSVANWVVSALGIICLAFLCAFAASLMVEMPCMGMEQLILSRGRQSGSKPAPPVNDGKRKYNTVEAVQDMGQATNGRAGGLSTGVKGTTVNGEPSVQKKEN
ncbi:nose resistant to fluoxetine protein 6-like [Branchiostoma lanceolatum]|uniref:nose resistant to fluoxetine protein 6-like n=1 Tax=Branchiostoma lanceolatum TaxID=7740 RepID=UPI003451AF30